MTVIPKTYDWSHLLGNSENPGGMVAQTANGTETNGCGSDGVDWRFGQNADGPQWNTDPRYEGQTDIYGMPTGHRGKDRERRMNAQTTPIPVARRKG